MYIRLVMSDGLEGFSAMVWIRLPGDQLDQRRFVRHRVQLRRGILRDLIHLQRLGELEA